MQADIPDWNFEGLPYTRTYQEADEQPTESNNPDSQRYTIDNDKTAAISGNYEYIKHSGYKGQDNPYHGAAIHLSDSKDVYDSFEIISNSGNIRVDAVSSDKFSEEDGHFYDAVQVYGERNLQLNSAKDIIIYANNNGIDSTDSDGNANNKKGNIDLVAAGSTYIHGGIIVQAMIKTATILEVKATAI